MELKKGLFFGSLAVAMMAVTSCSQDEAIEPTLSNEATFSTSIRPVQTRIDAWSGSEQVGVYMVSGSNFAASNVAYDVAASGDLTASVSGISYPATGNVAFKAYYPYASSNGATVAIDLTDGNTADHDLIFAETTADYNAATTDKVQLTFRHQLAKLSLKMADNSAATFKVNGLSSASFDVATGAVTNGTATADMTPNSNGDVIVLPGKSVTAVKITAGGQNYTWDASNVTFTKGMQTKYALTIETDGTVSAQLIASIEDWTQDDGSNPQPEESVIGKILELYNSEADVVLAEDFVVTASVVLVDGSNVHISDGIKGIDLYDYNLKNLELAIGDEVTFNANGATLTAYKGLVELKSTADGWTMTEQVTKTGNTKVLAPVEINAADIANYSSMYVTIKSATAADDNTAVYFDKAVKMTSPTGDFVIYAKGVSTLPVTDKTGDVSGVVGFYNAAQLYLTGADDIASIAGNPLAASATPTSVEAAGGTSTITITTDVAWTAAVSNNTANATLDVNSGTGNGTVTVTFPENTETTGKAITVTISGTDAADVAITINQVAKSDGSEPTFDNTDLTSSVFDGEGVVKTSETAKVYFYTNTKAYATDNTSAFETAPRNIKMGAGSGFGDITITVPAGVSKMRFFAIPWDGDTPQIVVTNNGTVENFGGNAFIDLYDGHKDSNVCMADGTPAIYNWSTFTAEEGVNMFFLDVTPGTEVRIQGDGSLSSGKTVFDLFGIQFK